MGRIISRSANQKNLVLVAVTVCGLTPFGLVSRMVSMAPISTELCGDAPMGAVRPTGHGNNIASRRARRFVDAAFQGRSLLRMDAFWFVFFGTLWHVSFLVSLGARWLNGDPAINTQGVRALYGAFATENVPIIVSFLVVLPMLGYDVVNFTHRLVGPLFRFRKVMQQMAAGKPVRPIELRRGDLPVEFVTAFNEMVAAWNQRIEDPPSGKIPNINEARPVAAV